MTHPHLNEILHQADAGVPIAALAASLSVSESTIYSILREHRPTRSRSARRPSSTKRPMVLGLLKAGIPASRVALLAGVTRAWVYAIQKGQK